MLGAILVRLARHARAARRSDRGERYVRTLDVPGSIAGFRRTGSIGSFGVTRHGDDVLVFDVSGIGHRENYVRIFARILDCSHLIGPIVTNLARLLMVRTLFLSTFESAPIPYTALVVARSLLGRRTVLLILRPLLTGTSPVARRLKRMVHLLLAGLPRTRLVLIMDSAGSHLEGRTYHVRDPEFWDLRMREKAICPTPLSDELKRVAAGRKILLFTGFLSSDKGADFLADTVSRPDWPTGDILVAAIGQVVPDAERACAAIERARGFVRPGTVSDDEFLSLFTVADLAWCCYGPGRDMSSGVFGRAVQLGVWPLVSAGSFLARQVEATGFGASVAFGDEAALIRLVALPHRRDGIGYPDDQDDAALLRRIALDWTKQGAHHAGRERQ
jgi:hypothetical protein